MATKQFLKGTGDNAYLYQETVGSAALGMDSSAATFKVVTSATSGALVTSTAQFTIDPAANGNVTIDPNGTGATVCQSGDLTVVAGNINMASGYVSSAQGVYLLGGNRFMHQYNQSLYLGNLAGNFTNVGASSNTGLGNNALQSTTTGDHNTIVGGNSSSASTTGNHNSTLGSSAAQNLTTGSYNSLLSSSAGALITTGSNNVAIGSGAGIGSGALFGLLTGSSNIGIGSLGATGGAGSAYTGAESSNILLGGATSGTVGESNVMRLGTTGAGAGQVNKCYLAGVDGVNVGSVAKVLTMASDQVGTATITAGTGISVTPGANTITIAASATSFAWSTITASQTAAVNNGYFINKAGTLALALPATSAVGDVIEVANINTATGVQFTQAANQQIFIGNTSTTLGAAGTLTSIAVGDTLKIVCRTANLVWQVTSMVGNWTPA